MAVSPEQAKTGPGPQEHSGWRMPQPEITIREAMPEDQATILHHRRSMFRDMGQGTPQELDRMAELTVPWLAQALGDGSYRGWLAGDRRLFACQRRRTALV